MFAQSPASFTYGFTFVPEFEPVVWRHGHGGHLIKARAAAHVYHKACGDEKSHGQPVRPLSKPCRAVGDKTAVARTFHQRGQVLFEELIFLLASGFAASTHPTHREDSSETWWTGKQDAGRERHATPRRARKQSATKRNTHKTGSVYAMRRTTSRFFVQLPQKMKPHLRQ